MEQSIEIPNSGGVHKSSLVTSGEVMKFDESVGTLWDIMQKGRKVSANGRCLGWRLGSNYSWLSYDEFLERVENFSSGLVNIGIKTGQSTFVGIYATNSVEILVSQYSCISLSVILVFLYDTLGPDACTFMINQSGLETIVCDSESKVIGLLGNKDGLPSLKYIITTFPLTQEINELAKRKGVYLYFFTDIEKRGKENKGAKLLPQPSDVCFILYTSGTSAQPKGVMLTHKNVASAIQATNLYLEKLNFGPEDTMISYLPLAHIFEQVMQALIFINGGSIGFYCGNIESLVEDMKILEPTFFPAVPRTLNKLYNKAQLIIKNKLIQSTQINCERDKANAESISQSAQKDILSSLGGKIRIICSGAAPISESVLEFFLRNQGIQIFEAYGQTECSGPCALNIIEGKTNGSVGPPVPSCVIKLKNVPEMGYLEKDGTGEICMKGHNIFEGYFKNPNFTASIFDEDGWLHTGDIGMWTPDGRLKIVDRKSNIFKLSQGEYVAPEKIESTYSLSPLVNQVLVYGESHQDFLVAVIIPEKTTVLSLVNGDVQKQSWEKICKNEDLKQIILKDLHHVGKSAGLHSFEQVKNIYLHPEPLTVDGEFLTPTSKFKRRNAIKYFKKNFEEMYKEKLSSFQNQ